MRLRGRIGVCVMVIITLRVMCRHAEGDDYYSVPSQCDFLHSNTDGPMSDSLTIG